MPFYRHDVEEWDALLGALDETGLTREEIGERPSGDFEYHTASARFSPEELGAVARLMLEVLTAAGATAFRVSYDGGNDEGFSHPEVLLIGTEARPVDDVLSELATGELIGRVRATARESRYCGNATYANASPLLYALDELAEELAARLLGDRYGTGPYELYGAFTADLKTGEIIDDPQAVAPEHWR